MLNIPETVKALYKRDGVNKNFRAHFPNGELPDITNGNIVQESVEFQESICSQDVFKFGLTEASVIEFETVGVANMYGMMIECSSEIDCSSLSAAEIAEIEAGTWDGEFVPLADSDLGFPFFRVPYGVFRVESCPRDHQAMAHRRVTAYGDTTLVTENELEKTKTELFFPYSMYEPNVESLFFSKLASVTEVELEDYGYQKINGRFYDSRPDNYKRVILTNGNEEYLGFHFIIDTLCVVVDGVYVRALDPDQIFVIDQNGNDYDSVIEECVEALDSHGIDYEASGYESAEDLLYSAAEYSVTNPLVGGYMPDMLHLSAHYIQTKKTDQYTLQTAEYGLIRFPKSEKPIVFYGGFSKESNDKGLKIHFYCPTKIEIVNNTQTLFTRYYSRCGFSVYKKDNPILPPIKIGQTLKQTLKQPQVFSSKRYTGYSFANAYSYKDVINGYLELMALFSTSPRGNAELIKRLSDSSPTAILPNDYSQMWFDEYDVQPVGTVRYAYTDDSGEEQIVDYKFGDGASVYDMTDNAVLKAMDSASPDVIESMLDTHFIPHLAPINLTPVDLEMKGLPYIEAGDAIAVTAQDGTVCNSYALRRELDGVQSLTDQIDSESGLIIDSEEGGT